MLSWTFPFSSVAPATWGGEAEAATAIAFDEPAIDFAGANPGLKRVLGIAASALEPRPKLVNFGVIRHGGDVFVQSIV